ncbi:MAG: phosphoadenosine phosphosulfate reductase [Alkalilacustris sp.]
MDPADDPSQPADAPPPDRRAWWDWFVALHVARGWVQPLGPQHVAALWGDGPVLIVSFDLADAVHARLPARVPLGLEVARAEGWAHLCLVATGPTWFRDPEVWASFDRLVDDGFFEEYDEVVFHGAGMGGYAAAAFSVAAPGATVVAVRPQATLSPDLAEWDDRHLAARRLDFTSRYGFAPDMVEGAERLFLLYDPDDTRDAMHAALFARPNVTRLRCRSLGPRPEEVLDAMGLTAELLRLAGHGRLTPRSLRTAFRARRGHPARLLRLLARLTLKGRSDLAARVARHALRPAPPG